MKIGWKTCFKIGLSAFILYLCIYFVPNLFGVLNTLLSAVMPLLLGCVIAYIVNILMSFYERHYFPKTKKRFLIKSRRIACMLAAFVTLLAVAALVIVLILPQLISCVKLLIAEVPDAFNTAVSKLEEMGIFTEDIVEKLTSIDWNARLEQMADIIKSGIGSAVNIVVDTVSSVVSGVTTAVIALIFSIYLLASRDTLADQSKRVMKRYIKKSLYEKIMYVLSVFNLCFKKYIVGQCTEAVILGLLCALGMWILQLPYAAMISALIAFTALIPIAGAYIGGGIGAFMIFTVSPIKAVIFIVFLVILQQLEGNLIYPRVVGSSMGLPGIWVLAAVTVGGGVMGIMGMMIFVPIVASVYRLLKENVNKPQAGINKTGG